MIKKAQNIKGEVKIPFDFSDLRGYDDKIDKGGSIEPFKIRFGSPVDQAAANLFDQLKNYVKESKDSKLVDYKISIFEIFRQYLQKVMELGDPLIWEYVKPEPPSAETESKCTIVVFGECGQGKSTDLSLISRIYDKKYNSVEDKGPHEF